MNKVGILLLALLSGCVSNPAKKEAAISPIKKQTAAIEFPVEMNIQIKDILKKHEGNILALPDIEAIDLSDIKGGTTYKYESTSADKFIYEYQKNEAGYYYFNLTTKLDGKSYPSIFRTNGLVSEIAQIKKPNKFSEYPLGGSCKFVIGSCEYKAGKKTKKVNTSFKGGVWTTSQPMGRYGRGYLVTKNIYDKNGMMLYKGTFSNQWADGKHSFTIISN